MGLARWALVVLVTAVIVRLLPGFFHTLPKVVQGSVAPGWQAVEHIFRSQVEQGLEKGAAFAVYHRGQLVVNLAGGYADVEAERPWRTDTVTCVYSSTKGVSAVAVALLVDRGYIAYDDPVARYWPEFDQNGKENITVRQILSHTAGLTVPDEDFSISDIVKDPERVSGILARQRPLWRPGSQHGYHGVTLGLYVDQLVRRVDPQHRDLAQFFHQEIKLPYDIDFYVGLPSEENYRCARMYPPSPVLDMVKTGSFRFLPVVYRMLLDPASEPARMGENPSGWSVERSNDPEVRSIPCGATRGFGTASGLAKIYSLVAHGGSLLSDQVTKDMLIPRATGIDRVVNLNITYASGMNLFESKVGSVMFGTPGAGGQMACGDRKYGLAWAYITNHHRLVEPLKDERWTTLVDAVYDIAVKDAKAERTKGG